MSTSAIITIMFIIFLVVILPLFFKTGRYVMLAIIEGIFELIGAIFGAIFKIFD